ncbi:MAG TPA: lipoyl(octanoyl) transferase LipB, partial [Gemmatimonadales bacterium]|nr:lipoyl(octanoyl) transferase LipB [Gemmatimonadales bacterium]
SPEALTRRGVEVVEVERGGDVTWHGPGQLVGYPILDLAGHKPDLHWYLRQLEELLIVALAPLGLTGERQSGLTGVWTGGRKVASIGVHVRRWVTFHGFALNVHPDLREFDQIVACGIQGVDMTSVERELVLAGKSAGMGRERLWQQVRSNVIEAAGRVFERKIVTENRALAELVAVEP